MCKIHVYFCPPHDIRAIRVIRVLHSFSPCLYIFTNHRFLPDSLVVRKKVFIFVVDFQIEQTMSNKSLDIAYFLSFCIEQYKEAKHLSGAEAAKLFSEYGVLEYLEEHFESLHSQSRQWILEDIEEFINLRKGEVS